MTIQKRQKEEEVITPQQEKLAAEWHKGLLSEAKNLQVKKIEFCQSLFFGYQNKYYAALGYSTMEEYVNDRWRDKEYHYQTIRKSIGLYKSMLEMAQERSGNEDDATKLANGAINSILKASDGHMTYVREAARYNIMDDLDKVEAIAKTAKNVNEYKDRLKSVFAGKERNPKHAEAQRGASASALKGIEFLLDDDDLLQVNEVLEIAARAAGSSKPFADMSGAEKGKILSHVCADFVSGSEEYAAMATPEARRAAAREYLRAAITMASPTGTEPSSDDLNYIMKGLVAMFSKLSEKTA